MKFLFANALANWGFNCFLVNKPQARIKITILVRTSYITPKSNCKLSEICRPVQFISVPIYLTLKSFSENVAKTVQIFNEQYPSYYFI